MAVRPKTLRPKNDLKKIEATSGWVVGLDEVGAGCLAGPLCVAAFAFPCEKITELKIKSRIFDSKQLLPELRAKAAEELKQRSDCFYKFLWIDIGEIDAINIYWARMKAFWTLILELEEKLASPRFIVDGPRLGRKHGVTPEIDELRMLELEARILAQSKADAKFFAVAAASILAKVERDTHMAALGTGFDGYAWSRNKGYATRDHINAIQKFGLTVHHRATFCTNLQNITILESADELGDEAIPQLFDS